MKLAETLAYKNEWKFWGCVLFFAASIMSIPYFSFEHLNKLDSLFHLNRIEGIKEGLLAFEIPVRINGYALNGYGTADSIMYPDLLLYFPAILRICGLSVSLSWNLTWVALIFSGVFLSWLGYSLWIKDIRAGALAALFYSSIYIFQIVSGGMVGFAPLYFMLPFAAAILFLILQEPKNTKLWPVFVIIFTFFIQNHIPSMIMFGVFAFICFCFHIKSFSNKEQRIAIFKIVFFIILLNIWRIFPFVYFYETVSFQINHPSWVTSFEDVARSLNQLLKYEFYLGFPFLILTLIFAIYKRKCKKFIYVLGLNFFLILICTKIFPWGFIENNLPFGKILLPLQLPERFLPFGFVFLCLFIGKFLAEKFDIVFRRKILVCFFMIFVAVTCIQENIIRQKYPEFLPYIYNYMSLEKVPSYTDDKYYVQEDYLYSDVHFYKLRNEKGEVYGQMDFKTEVKLFDIQKHGSRLEFSYHADDDAKIQVPLFYWEGYEAKIQNGEKLPMGFNENRFMEVYVKKGENKLKIHYAGLPIFRICDLISFVSIIIFFILIFEENKVSIFKNFSSKK